jgi:anionic cell wall polymer biosynthesis LytR-Cps2A-Psr (LCP) family protein
VTFTLYKNVGKIKVGENNLNGKLALAFARTRKSLDGGDFDRGNNQMKVIKAIVDKATSGTTILTNYSDIMKSIDGMFVMNIPSSLIGEVVKRQVTDMSGWNIMSFSVKGTGDNMECYSAPGELLYVINPNERYVGKATELIQKVYSGETLTEEILKVS